MRSNCGANAKIACAIGLDAFKRLAMCASPHGTLGGPEMDAIG